MTDKPEVMFEPLGKLEDDDLRAAFAGEAVLSNKVYMTKSPGGVRLAFMEVWGEAVPPQFRTGIFLSYPDAVALRDLLVRQLDDVAKELAKAGLVDEAPKHG
jgi:hypothetical protein